MDKRAESVLADDQSLTASDIVLATRDSSSLASDDDYAEKILETSAAAAFQDSRYDRGYPMNPQRIFTVEVSMKKLPNLGLPTETLLRDIHSACNIRRLFSPGVVFVGSS